MMMLLTKTCPLSSSLPAGRSPSSYPKGFTEHAVAENVYAGKAMARRANYQYGVLLEAGVTGKLAMGIGHRPVYRNRQLYRPHLRDCADG